MWQSIEHWSNVDVIKNIKTTDEADVTDENTYQNYLAVLFFKFINFVPIDLKIGTHWLDLYYVPK